MGEGACFIRAVLYVVNGFEQRNVICNNLRLVPLDRVQTESLPVAVPLQSALPVPKSRQVCQLLNQGMIATGNHYFERFAALCNTPGGSQGGWYEFAPVYSKWYSAYRRKPLRRDAPSSPFRGGWTWLPGGGAGRPNGLTEGVSPVEW